MRLVAFGSKKFPPVAIRYSISEIKLCGLAVNIIISSPYLKHIKFTVIRDYSALLYILNTKRDHLS